MAWSKHLYYMLVEAHSTTQAKSYLAPSQSAQAGLQALETRALAGIPLASGAQQ